MVWRYFHIHGCATIIFGQKIRWSSGCKKHPRRARLVKWVSFLHFFVRRNRELTAWFLGTLIVITVVRKIEDYGSQALKIAWSFSFITSMINLTRVIWISFAFMAYHSILFDSVYRRESALDSQLGSWHGLQLLTLGLSHRVYSPILAFTLKPSPAPEHAMWGAFRTCRA
jgi:hypothetical protein